MLFPHFLKKDKNKLCCNYLLPPITISKNPAFFVHTSSTELNDQYVRQCQVE